MCIGSKNLRAAGMLSSCKKSENAHMLRKKTITLLAKLVQINATGVCATIAAAALQA